MVTPQATPATRRPDARDSPTGSTGSGGAWIHVTSRVAAAAVGGYALSSLTAVCLSRLLPMARSEAVLTGTMASFAVYVCVVLWVFSASSARRAWAGLVLSAALPGAALLAHRIGAGW